MATLAKRVVEVENVPVAGESVLVRAIPPSLDRLFERWALRGDGTFDGPKYEQLRFQYAVVDPSFTMDQVKRIFEHCGPAVHLVLDAAAAISHTPRVRIDARIPRRYHRALRTAATISQALQRRGAHQPRLRAGGTRRLGCGRPAARRSSRVTRAGPSDPDLSDSEKPPLNRGSTLRPIQQGGGDERR